MKTSLFAWLCLPLLAAGGEEKAPSASASQSIESFHWSVPKAFSDSAKEGSMLPNRFGQIPRRGTFWAVADQEISVRQLGVPASEWSAKGAAQVFRELRDKTFAKGGVELLSERDYELQGFPVHSMLLAYSVPSRFFERNDYVAVAPFIYLVSFSSPRKEDLSGPASQELFGSLTARKETSAPPINRTKVKFEKLELFPPGRTR